MPTVLLVKNKLKSIRIYKGRKCMTATAEFCQYPGDHDGCCLSLIQSCREDSTDKHCIFEGLKANCRQCRDVLQQGLYNKNSQVNNAELQQACKEVVLLGYPLRIKVIPEIFYESYYKLVRSVIYRYGIKDNDDPSADDVFQNVFRNLHKQFLRGASVKGSLTTYITTVTLNECYRAIRSAHKQVNLENEDEIKDVKHSSATFIPFEAVDLWEYFDRQLLRSAWNELKNRIILAQQCIEGCSSGKRPSAKQLRADWQLLSQVPKNDIVALHGRVVIEIKKSPAKDVVPLTADMINSGVAEPYRVAIIFGAATRIDMVQTSKLVDQLSNLSETAVHTRICRIYTVLQPPGMEDGK